MAGDDTDREEGVDFTDLNPVLEELPYPVSMEEFVAEHGDHTIERTNADPITVRELFEGMGDDTYESPDEVRQSILNFMPRDSVGRARYSDRGGQTPETPETDGQDESV